MGLIIHGSPHSTCTQRVLTTLAEKGVDHEMHEINFAKLDHKQPAHLKLQPFGKVPVLEDDGYFVYESRAICKYIAKKYAGQGTKLIPDEGDLKAYGLFEQVRISLRMRTGGRVEEKSKADEGCRRARLSRAISTVRLRGLLLRKSSNRKEFSPSL